MTSCSIEISKVDELAPCNTHCMQQEIVCILDLGSNFPLADLKSCVSLLSSSANTADSLENLG